MEIRPPNKPNYPAIAAMLGRALGRSLSAEALAGQVMADQHFDPNLVWLAREKGEMLGYLATVLETNQAWIKLIAVEPGRWRQGLGREMIARAEERLSGEGATILRAGFGPGPLFFPGVPEGAAANFFRALGFDSRPGGVMATIAGEPLQAAKPSFEAAHILMEAVAPQWWSEVEERLSYAEPRLAMSADGTALCLADPGKGIGPLFCSSDKSVREAVGAALALARGGRQLSDFRVSEWWQSRFKLEGALRCHEFQKDLREASHA